MSAATKLSGLRGTSLHDAIRKITTYATCLAPTPSSHPASQPTGSCNLTTQFNSAPQRPAPAQPNPSPSIPASSSHPSPQPVTVTAAVAPESSTSALVPTPAAVVQLRPSSPSSSPSLPSSSWGPIWHVHGNPSIAASRFRAPLSPQPLAHQAPQPSSPFAATATLATKAATRHLSVQPEATVYSGPSARNPARVTLRTIRKKYDAGEPLTMVTAYDYPSAVHVEAAGIDILLVGDSAAMVVHGHDTTLPISMDDMLAHCKAVARGARRAFLVGDLPFGCYETDVRDAVRSAVRMLKEGGMDAVKLEGGSPARVEAARAIVETGVAVMGHVGLTPQSVSVIGGFRPQAQVADEALRVLDQALALQRAGCFALVLECIPGPIAAAITRSLSIPTIGIGAGGECSGQVLVYHDLLGMMSHPHHAKVAPKFCKQYARVGDIIGDALERYRQEVVDGTFPGSRFSPYKISDQELANLAEALRGRGLGEAAKAVEDEVQRAAEARTATAAAAAGTAAVNTGAAAPAGSGGDAAGGGRSGSPTGASDKGAVRDAK